MSEEFELLINNEIDVKVEMFCAGKEEIRNRKMTDAIARNEYRSEHSEAGQ